jgi:hypothetical protein
MGIPEKAGRVFPLFRNPKLKLEKRSRVPPYPLTGAPQIICMSTSVLKVSTQVDKHEWAVY